MDFQVGDLITPKNPTSTLGLMYVYHCSNYELAWMYDNGFICVTQLTLTNVKFIEDTVKIYTDIFREE
jgi:hypothetical protein